MDAPSDLDEFQDYAKRVIDEYPQMDEENTRSKLIQPLLKVLGWSVAFDAKMEHKLQVGSTRKSVDYALEIEDSPVIFVEAKGLYEDMDDDHINQIESYMRVADINWGVLTNGKIYKIYRMDYRGQNSKITKIHEIDVTEVSKHKKDAHIISKDSIESGESESVAKRRTKISEAQQTLRQKKEDISEDIARIIEDETNSVVTNYAESMSREFIDDIVEELEDESVESEPVETAEETEVHNKNSKNEQDSDDYLSYLEEEVDFSINENGELVAGKSLNYASDALVKSLELMFEEGHLTDDDIPLKIRDRSYFFVNYSQFKDPQEDKEMESKRSICDGKYYVNTNYNNKDKVKILRYLIEEYC